MSVNMFKIAFAVGVIAVSSHAALAQDTRTIGVSFPHAGQPVVVATFNAAREKGKELGFEFVMDDPGDDLTRQFNTLDTWIDGHTVDAIVSLIPNSPDVFNSVATRAKEAGIPFISYAASIEAESSFVNWDHEDGGYQLGEQAAAWINARPNGAAKVALLTFEPGEWSRKRREGIEKALKELAPNAEIVAKQDAALDPSEAAAALGSMLQANPDLNVVLSIMSAGGEGAYQAFLNAGREPNDPDLFIGDVDGSARSLTLIQQGTMYKASSSLDLDAIGEAIPELASRLLAGEDAPGIMIPYVMITPGSGAEAQRLIDQWK